MTSSRLTHTSPQAYLRLMQMSGKSVFVFAEGWTDKFFYEGICDATVSCKSRYQLTSSTELPVTQGGKLGVIEFFEFLKDNNSLIDLLQEKTTISVFFLDKDIDELLGNMIDSPHVIYTKYYNFENYIFAHGNITGAIAASALLSKAVILAGFNKTNAAWCRGATEMWKDWVKLCVFSNVRNVNYGCNYGVNQSRINDTAYSKTNLGLFTRYLHELENRSNLTPLGFKRVWNKISRQVDEIYAQNEHQAIFNGKWYSSFVLEDVIRIAGNVPFSRNGISERIKSCLLFGLNFKESWAEDLKQSLDTLINENI